MRIFLRSIALGALTVAVAACGGPQDPNMEMTGEQLGPNLKGPRDGVYLRASFDDDPSHFMGRFISNDVGVSDVDENRGIQTECTEFVTYKEVRASGNFDEYYNSSTEVSANLGIQTAAQDVVDAAPGGDGKFGHSAGTEIRVKYDLNKKLVANIEDPAGFSACCAEAPGRCTDRYIGEFWYGTGTVFEKSGRATDADVSVAANQGEGGLQVADGWVWRRGTTFDDVYFAFRVMDRVATDDCAWADQLPKSADGQYFVGVSAPAPTEDLARSNAMKNARTQAVRYLGESIVAKSTTTAGVVEGYVNDENVVTTVAEGIASFVKDDRYCAADTMETPEGVKYQVKVLAFFPNEGIQQAEVAAAEAVEAKMEADGALTPEARKELKAIQGQQ